MKMKKKKDKQKPFIQKILEMEKKQRLKDEENVHILEKSTMNKRLIYVMILFILMFLFIVLYLVYFQLFKAESLSENSHNKRLWVNENVIKRGNIYDRNGNVLVYNEKDENGNSFRVYSEGKVNSAFTGYNSVKYGKSGLEKTYNKELLNISDQPTSKIRDMVEKTGVGNNLNLTIDQTIQEIAYNSLGNHIGSIVVMDPRNGEVLAMVSKPSYNPNTLDEDWDLLIQDTDAPLLNRSSQGIYRPASTMKIVSADTILRSGINTNFNDTGSVTIQNYKITNYGDYSYGQVNLRSALMNSLNTYFASKINQIGKDKFKKVTEDYMFNKNYKFDLEKVSPKIPFDDLNQVDTAMTAFGYGKTKVTPLHMAMIASTIANDGKMMQPRLVRNVVNKDGKVIKESKSEVISDVTSTEIANTIRDYMVDVVNYGTAKAAYLQSVQIAGKSGTVDKKGGGVDVWFVGFAPAYDPKLAFAIVVEDTDELAGEVAVPIGGQMINNIVNNVNLY
ncbi:peptidoglycan D,D-transpeptidase FtsI family protein [Anaerococcus hydrogenalis]|uniref:Penicillin-binding protein n=1 Tax=Anaerococcus hydrogenalis TaxID=33029 RepID=A0A2N6UL32_9FIRM|nr:penicillin-binding protein 2 [Anaerococcus hydrogenalis]MDK7694474.1 penicillin-binding protein 2 [Anaerococcus hydrogenalis]MDK7696252.1 penicillin-binding protein 2 [Anaerococcus hydrogenalis]MDK7707501.1 penicillin-binding protein 2 [Anaerococcus hydrogenalis]PMC82514.1 penicillin-binding protein [Anaerococcus hydrogenalis]